MRILLAVFLLLNSLLAFSDDTLTVNVSVRSRAFVIKLPSNPSTGYQWRILQYDNTILKMTGSEYQAPTTQLFGASGTMNFSFSLISDDATYPKSMIMLFSYGRGWDPASDVKKQVFVHFK